MYTYIGNDIIIKNSSIIGIFNIDYVKNTREYKSLKSSLEEKDKLIKIDENNQKSFILTNNMNETKAYITKINVNTLLKRLV